MIGYHTGDSGVAANRSKKCVEWNQPRRYGVATSSDGDGEREFDQCNDVSRRKSSLLVLGVKFPVLARVVASHSLSPKSPYYILYLLRTTLCIVRAKVTFGAVVI